MSLEQMVQCDVCFGIASKVIVCGNGHSLCRPCLATIQGTSMPKCPMRCELLETPIPDRLSEQLIEEFDLRAEMEQEQEQEQEQQRDATPILEIDDPADLQPEVGPLPREEFLAPPSPQAAAAPAPAAPVSGRGVRVPDHLLTPARSRDRVLSAIRKARKLHSESPDLAMLPARLSAAYWWRTFKAYTRVVRAVDLHTRKFGTFHTRKSPEYVASLNAEIANYCHNPIVFVV